MSPPTHDDPSGDEPKSLSWGFRLILIASALYIAGCSAFFSVRGLGLLFIGSDVQVMIMAASLEIGKLVAASFLYRYWELINGALRFYLTLAVLVLIAITSLGNYGYLARAYEKTVINNARNEAAIADLDKQISEVQHQIEESRGKNSRINNSGREDIAKAQARLTQATESLNQSLARLQEQRKALSERRTQELAAPMQRTAEQVGVITKSIAAEEAASAKAVGAEESTIAGLNDRIKNLDQAVEGYTKQGVTNQLLFFEKDNIRLGQELREQQKPERDQILAKLTETSNRIEKMRSEANARIERLRGEQSKNNVATTQEVSQLRDFFNLELARIDNDEKNLRKSGSDGIADLEKQLAALQENSQGKATMTDAEIEGLYKNIRTRNDEIRQLRDTIAASDIGSYRFVARAFDAEADDVVKWLMLALVAVFDPLAVTLIIAFNMAVQVRRKRRTSEARESQGAAGQAARTAWSAWEITVVAVLASIIALIAAWLWATERSNQSARSNAGTSSLIPGDSFAVVTFRPDELRQKGSQAFPEWLERTGGKGMTVAIAELLKNGLDPHSEIYGFAKFPTNKLGQGTHQNPVMICGAIIRVTDPVVAEVALSRIADQMNEAIRSETGRGASKLSRSRSMVKYGEGRYMDPEGGFFTFGLTNRTAIILVEFEGNSSTPCVEQEIRECLTRFDPKNVKPSELRDKLPSYSKSSPGALTFWLDSNRFFRRLPMSDVTRVRYEQMQNALDFELLMTVRTNGNDSLVLNGRYVYQFDRFREGASRDPLQLVSSGINPKSPDLGWKMINRCVDTLDYESMVERMRGALSDEKVAGAQQVLVEKSISTPRDAKFTMNTRFDAKAGPPIMAALQILSQ